MTRKVLLLMPMLRTDWDRTSTSNVDAARPPLGMQYVMATLRDAGLGFHFIDQRVNSIPDSELIHQAATGAYDIVGLHSNVMTTSTTLPLISELKRSTSAKVIVGGPGTVRPEKYLEAGADVVFLGEAEGRLPALIEVLRNRGGADLAAIPGIWYRDRSGAVSQTPPAPMVGDLDALPIPYRPPELVPFYNMPVSPAERGTHIGLMAARGCMFRCSFCSSHDLWSHQVRSRSVDSVLSEMEKVLKDWPRAQFWFIDDIFGANDAWVEEFCQKLIARGLGASWTCILHPLSFLKTKERIIPLMARAGCNNIMLGGQSSSPQVLKLAHRSPKEPEELAKLLDLCYRENILTVVTYIFGLPGETEQTMEDTIRWTLAHKAHMIDFHPLHVLPGSDLERRYPAGPVTSLSREQIDRKCAEAFRRFYLRPSTAFRIARFVLLRNPGFLLRVGFVLKRLFAVSTATLAARANPG